MLKGKERKGIDPSCLENWSESSPFLKLPETNWPNFEDNTHDTHRDDLKVLKEKKTFQRDKKVGKHYVASAEVYPEFDYQKTEDNPLLSHLLKTCSTYSKMRKTLAYVLRFIQNTRKNILKSGPISVQEVKAGKLQALKWSQLHIDEASLDKKLVAKRDE